MLVILLDKSVNPSLILKVVFDKDGEAQVRESLVMQSGESDEKV